MQTIAPIEGLTLTEQTFTTDDGVELFYRAWVPASGTPTRAVLLFHRGHEHGGRLAHVVRELALPNCAYFAWDARGHGRSPGERGAAPSFARVIADIDNFAHHVASTHAVAIHDMAVIGHSVGAVSLATWVHDYAPPVRAMVLVTPAFQVKLYVPLAIPALRFMSARGRLQTVKSYVRPNVLTHDFAEQQAYHNDTLITRDIATNILLGLFDTSRRVVADAGAIETPTFILTAGRDWVVHTGPQQRFFENLSSPVKQWRAYPGLYHAIFHEKDRAEPIADVRQFLEETLPPAHLPPPPPGEAGWGQTTQGDSESQNNLDEPSVVASKSNSPQQPPPNLPREGRDPTRADVRGYTRYEFDRLASPLPIFSPRWWYWGLQRLSLGTLGRLSDGVSLGWRTGFDSGESLDHVYRNSPSGRGPIGRLIDKQYNNAIGWRGIRQRKVHLQQLLRSAILQLREQRPRLHVVDIAAGPGRYALEVLKELDTGHGDDLHATLRDRSASGLAQGAEIAKNLGVRNVVYEHGDAFSVDSINTIAPAPDIAIVSGLYELFGDNTMVGRSINALAGRMEKGSLLIYTNQPWHPQVEMIARVLINRDGKPWIMRRRTQLEMDALVAAAGFEKQRMLIDEWGIFTVSLAVKK